VSEKGTLFIFALILKALMFCSFCSSKKNELEKKGRPEMREPYGFWPHVVQEAQKRKK